MGNLKKLLTRLFDPKKYWTIEVNKAAKKCKETQERYYIAKKHHRKRSHLRFEFELANKQFDEAFKNYSMVVWGKDE